MAIVKLVTNFTMNNCSNYTFDFPTKKSIGNVFMAAVINLRLFLWIV